ncbi:MAG TPA: polysaccharide biosynthesis/export family protein [Gemmatimonadales bacterium]|nr:polysaccharide biosynthesis/export family protein [Gemmatimonadales bacterium]
MHPERTSFFQWARLLIVTAALLAPGSGSAQEVDPTSRGTAVTRAALQAALAEAEQIANSDGYSDQLREQKRMEASLIRSRLLEGDFFPGDQIVVSVAGDTAATSTLTVGPGRVISLLGLPDIPLNGVLRSEIEDYLRQQLARYIRNPEVKARPLLRLSITGGIGAPGFYQLDPDILVSAALMTAGGITNATELDHTKVLRDKEEVVSGEQFARAVREGGTLDQLNLRAGDEIIVGQRKTRDWWTTLRTIATVPALVLSVYGMGRLFGIF